MNSCLFQTSNTKYSAELMWALPDIPFLAGCIFEQLLLPLMKVYGMLYDEDNYSPYHGWNNTAEQLEKMISFEVHGLEECVGSSP